MPDYIFMLESRLSPEQLQILNRAQQEAQDLSLNIYLVGGAVRDLMTGSPIRDLDFVTEGNPFRLARRLQGRQPLHAEMSESLRSAELVLSDGVSLSLAMARNEFYQTPGQPPQVAAASILEDLRRRDFSVNAMGISLTPGSRGLLLDPTNGLADIENRELRVLHNYSLVHDPLRLLRLIRFSTRLGFRPEPRTRELFETALERGYEDHIRVGPLGREVKEITREANVVAVLKALAEHELLAVVHPMLQKRKPDYDGLAKLQKYRQQAEEAGYRLDPFTLVLHYLLRRLKGGTQRRLLRNLGFKKAIVEQVFGLEKEARQVVKVLSRRRQLPPREIFHLLSPLPVGLLIFVLAKYSHKRKVQAKIYNYLFKYCLLRNKLPVRELQLMGVPTGPKLDHILQKYFEAQLDGKLRRRVEQLRFLRKMAGLPKVAPRPARKPGEQKEKGRPAPLPSKPVKKQPTVPEKTVTGTRAAPPKPPERRPPKQVRARRARKRRAKAAGKAPRKPAKKPKPKSKRKPKARARKKGRRR